MPFPVPFLHGRQKTNAPAVFLFIVIVALSHVLTDSRANEKNGNGFIAAFFGQKIFLRSMIDKYPPLPGNKYCRRKD